MKKILIIEDDPATVNGIEEVLKQEHFQVFSVSNGKQGFEQVKHTAYDLIILDIMLPDKSGTEILKDLRKQGIDTRIIMLTAKKEEMDKVLNLELGADDYVPKPFSIRELVARVKRVLSRDGGTKPDIEEFSFGKVFIDFKGQTATRDNKPVSLSTLEFKVMKFFVQHEGEVISRNTLLDEVWGYENYPSTRTVDNFILSLRKKIEDDPANPKHILTLHGAGYKFVK
jgi:two-component system alkaline phosphatase synthesis response regulator PhoP